MGGYEPRIMMGWKVNKIKLTDNKITQNKMKTMKTKSRNNKNTQDSTNQIKQKLNAYKSNENCNSK